MSAKTTADLRAELRRLDREMAVARGAISDAVRTGADTAPLRAELRAAEVRRADVAKRIAAEAEAARAEAAEYADAECERLVQKIGAAINNILAQLEAPAHA